MARYDAHGQRVTDCCGAYSTFVDPGDTGPMVLACKRCWRLVPQGQGDGTEFKPGVDPKEYWTRALAEL